jgi:dephospho-CoA kinase
MKAIALTGGIGMGKSTVATVLRAGGIPVVDSDDLAREVVQRGQPALAEIQAAFGDQLLAPTGELRREELARIVFADPEARRKLEAITHPRIKERWRAHLASWRRAGHKFGVVVIPLLFEIGAEAEFDRVICVACSAASQAARLHARGWSVEECQQRLAAQLPVGEKLARAHHVVWTEGTPEVMALQLTRLFAD